MDHLRLSLLQAQLHWEDRLANFRLFEKLIDALGETDLIILPEMFTTGFSMEPEGLYDLPDGDTLKWMQKQASRTNAAITGSAIIKDGGNFYNRLYFVFPNGDYTHYDKKHLFTLAGEQKVYSAGKEHLLIDYRGWKIMPLICYDLRFPVWCRNTTEADLQIYVANWPKRRNEAWKTLLKARAIENMCFVAGLNRVGEDGNGVDHSGDSVLHDELGGVVGSLTPHQQEAVTFNISRERMLESRQRFQFLSDRDRFSLD